MKIFRLLIFVLHFALFGCIQEMELFKETEDFLVIDGHLDNLEGNKSVRVYYVASFNLQPDYSRTEKCDVRVADNLGNEVSFKYSDYGVFKNNDFAPVIGRAYKLRVTFENGREYESDFDTLYPVAAIDSIRFEHDQLNKQLHFYIDFRDDPNRQNYYRWRYKNTYEFVAPLAMEMSLTNQRMQNDECIQWGIPPPLASDVARCWIDVYDNQYLKVERDKLFNGQEMNNFYIFSLPLNRQFQYGIYVSARQLSLSKRAYEYWQAIQDQMNNTGTIFEKSNYHIKGNIKSLSDPDEPVLGFFSISAAEAKPIFIGNYMGLWEDICCTCVTGCPAPRCMDCRKSGNATNIKPAFWPH